MFPHSWYTHNNEFDNTYIKRHEIGFSEEEEKEACVFSKLITRSTEEGHRQ